MFEMVNVIVNIKSIWFIAYIILIYGQYKTWYLLLRQFLVQDYSENMKKLLFASFILLNILGAIIQVICIRTQVIYDFGFLLSVAYPVFIFYASIIICIGFSIRAFKKKFMSLMQLYSLVPCMHLFFLTQLSFSFANSSPCGIFLSFIYLIKIFLQKSLFFSKWQIPRKKEE